jgi:methylthioribose-1-phosphate isomerase
MKIAGMPHRTIEPASNSATPDVRVIDQTRLPHEFAWHRLANVEAAARAISDMVVRGAPLIGATAAYGMALAVREDSSDRALAAARERLARTRPTAVNLRGALDAMIAEMAPLRPEARVDAAYRTAARLCDEDVAMCAAIGDVGLAIIRERAGRRPVQVLTHCNAGWLATVDWGTALAPVYRAHDAGIPVHVWVDETRPRNQGASLTAWELGQHGVPHTVIADNAGGHLMQHGQVDMVLVGSDRTTRHGDVCNKIGTYLKALAARANGVPFYVALPSSSVDWSVDDGLAHIPIEERDGDEVGYVWGRGDDGTVSRVRVVPEGCRVANPGFDVTPAALVTGLVTERGLAPATRAGLASLFPEHA